MRTILWWALLESFDTISENCVLLVWRYARTYLALIRATALPLKILALTVSNLVWGFLAFEAFDIFLDILLLSIHRSCCISL